MDGRANLRNEAAFLKFLQGSLEGVLTLFSAYALANKRAFCQKKKNTQ